MLVLEGLVGSHRTLQRQLLHHYWWGIDLDYRDIDWFALGSITMNKASGGDGIPIELFQILKDDAVKVLLSIC